MFCSNERCSSSLHLKNDQIVENYDILWAKLPALSCCVLLSAWSECLSGEGKRCVTEPNPKHPNPQMKSHSAHHSYQPCVRRHTDMQYNNLPHVLPHCRVAVRMKRRREEWWENLVREREMWFTMSGDWSSCCLSRLRLRGTHFLMSADVAYTVCTFVNTPWQTQTQGITKRSELILETRFKKHFTSLEQCSNWFITPKGQTAYSKNYLDFFFLKNFGHDKIFVIAHTI